MSTEYGVIAILGFKVPHALTHTTSKREQYSCSHARSLLRKPNHPKFCPDCGFAVRRWVESQDRINPALLEKLDPDRLVDDEIWHDTGWKADLDGATIELWRAQDHDDSFVGVTLGYVGDVKRGEVSQSKVPPLPTEKAMAKFLESHGIPFDKRTWGVYMVSEIS